MNYHVFVYHLWHAWELINAYKGAAPTLELAKALAEETKSSFDRAEILAERNGLLTHASVRYTGDGPWYDQGNDE